MDPIEAAKWAVGTTASLGSIAFALKKLLTIWGKESTNASGVSATNEIITTLREEVEHSRKNLKAMRTDYDEAMEKITELQKTLTGLRDENHKLVLNNKALTDALVDDSDFITPTTFTDSNIGQL